MRSGFGDVARVQTTHHDSPVHDKGHAPTCECVWCEIPCRSLSKLESALLPDVVVVDRAIPIDCRNRKGAPKHVELARVAQDRYPSPIEVDVPQLVRRPTLSSLTHYNESFHASRAI